MMITFSSRTQRDPEWWARSSRNAKMARDWMLYKGKVSKKPRLDKYTIPEPRRERGIENNGSILICNVSESMHSKKVSWRDQPKFGGKRENINK